MADPYRVTSDWTEGYDAGYQAGMRREQTLRNMESGRTVSDARRRIKKPKAKRSRKPSKYNLFMKKELKRLRKKHPRTAQTVLFKRAAKAWRRHR